jgi:thioredoxin 1
VFNKVKDSFNDVEFVEVDIDENQELSAALSVRSVPTVVFEKDGNVVDTIVGSVSESVLRDKVAELM